jgi:hypothetical protein
MGSKYLRRYTDLTALIRLLRKRKLTLLDPSSWDDSDDSYYLSLYKEKLKLKSALVLCFTDTDERYSYWRIFAPGPSGVCIRFRRSELEATASKQANLQMKPVDYLTLDDMRGRKLKTAELPFLKRFAFQKVLHAIEGSQKLSIVKSTLIGNEEWKQLGEDAL